MPWSGAVAGLCWGAQDALRHASADDTPGGASTQVIRNHLGLNYGSQACLLVLDLALLCFATAVRSLLRSREGRESTYSSVAFGGWLVLIAGLSQMVVWNRGLINGAADASDDSALHTLGYVSYFGWAGMGIGLAAAFLAMGLGGIRTAALPRWFAILTLVLGVLGVLGALGNAGIPRGAGHLRAAAVLVDRCLDRRRSHCQGRDRPDPTGTGHRPGAPMRADRWSTRRGPRLLGMDPNDGQVHSRTV